MAPKLSNTCPTSASKPWAVPHFTAIHVSDLVPQPVEEVALGAVGRKKCSVKPRVFKNAMNGWMFLALWAQTLSQITVSGVIAC